MLEALNIRVHCFRARHQFRL